MSFIGQTFSLGAITASSVPPWCFEGCLATRNNVENPHSHVCIMWDLLALVWISVHIQCSDASAMVTVLLKSKNVTIPHGFSAMFAYMLCFQGVLLGLEGAKGWFMAFAGNVCSRCFRYFLIYGILHGVCVRCVCKTAILRIPYGSLAAISDLFCFPSSLDGTFSQCFQKCVVSWENWWECLFALRVCVCVRTQKCFFFTGISRIDASVDKEEWNIDKRKWKNNIVVQQVYTLVSNTRRKQREHQHQAVERGGLQQVHQDLGKQLHHDHRGTSSQRRPAQHQEWQPHRQHQRWRIRVV